MRYRLQRKEQYVLPNILGNCSFPVYTTRWKDIAGSDDRNRLEQYQAENGLVSEKYRIIDVLEALKDEAIHGD